MLDEDVVLKFARYTNERVLIINAFLMAILPAIFNGGNSMIAMCLIFSIGLIAPINVISYPRIWVDAQEYVRLKYFVSILPIAALLCLTIFRASTPAISELYIEGEAFDYISNFEEISLAFTDSFTAICALITLLALFAVGASIYFITQSRFIIQTLISLCCAGVAILTFFGVLSSLADYFEVPAVLGFFTSESFATFDNAEDWAAFAFLWSCALFAVTIYTPQRFRLLNMLQSIRTLILAIATAIALSALYTGSPIFKIFVCIELCIVFAVYALNTFPSEKNLKMHWRSARSSRMPKRPLKEVILPFAMYSIIAIAFALLAFKFHASYRAFCSSDEGVALALERASLDQDTMDIIKERPLYGWGAASFPAVFALKQGDDVKMQKLETPSSDYLRARAEYGVLGIALVAIIPLLLWLKVMLKNGISKSGIIFASSIALILLYSYFSTPFLSVSVLASFWIIFFCYLAWEKAEII